MSEDNKLKKEDNQISINELVECHPFEGAYLLFQYLREKGYNPRSVSKTTEGFGGPVTTPPSQLSLELSPGVSKPFTWGCLKLQNIDGVVETAAASNDEDRLVFKISGTLSSVHKLWTAELGSDFRAYVKYNSIYKGKAFELPTHKKDSGGFFSAPRQRGDVNWGSAPKLIDTGSIKSNEFILDSDTKDQIDQTVFTPIKKADLCRQNNVALKRGVLLAGPYGTGKTLTARATAKVCVDNGWTFIMVDNPKALAAAFSLAQIYSPAVIFAEDGDQSIKGKARTQELNDILNTIDGIKSKTYEVMLVLTTNHAESINEAMLRPGRIDSVVTYRNPSADTIAELLKFYGAGMMEENFNYGVSTELVGCSPAFVREIVSRAKLKAFSDNSPTITPTMISMAHEAMRGHIFAATQKDPEPAEPFQTAFKNLLLEATAEASRERYLD
jgi:DNA polymerase III delta prime subunit